MKKGTDYESHICVDSHKLSFLCFLSGSQWCRASVTLVMREKNPKAMWRFCLSECVNTAAIHRNIVLGLFYAGTSLSETRSRDAPCLPACATSTVNSYDNASLLFLQALGPGGRSVVALTRFACSSVMGNTPQVPKTIQGTAPTTVPTKDVYWHLIGGVWECV